MRRKNNEQLRIVLDGICSLKGKAYYRQVSKDRKLFGLFLCLFSPQAADDKYLAVFKQQRTLYLSGINIGVPVTPLTTLVLVWTFCSVSTFRRINLSSVSVAPTLSITPTFLNCVLVILSALAGFRLF